MSQYSMLVLPPELVRMIGCYCSYRDLCTLRILCKGSYKILTTDVFYKLYWHRLGDMLPNDNYKQLEIAGKLRQAYEICTTLCEDTGFRMQCKIGGNKIGMYDNTYSSLRDAATVFYKSVRVFIIVGDKNIWRAGLCHKKIVSKRNKRKTTICPHSGGYGIFCKVHKKLL